MFNLEKSIEEWRKQMLAAGIKTPVPLEELEIHLREEIERRTKLELSEQEIFNSAVQKIGQAHIIQNEFKKLNHITFIKKYTAALRIFFYFILFIFGLYGILIVLHTIELWTTGGGFLPVALLIGVVTLLLAGVCFQINKCRSTIHAHRILGTLWMAICGISGIPLLWTLLRDAILFPKAFSISTYLYLPTLLCLAYLAGVVAGVFLFCGARWARWFIGMTAVLTFIVTTAMIVNQGSVAQFYYIVSFFEIVSIVQLFLPRYVAADSKLS